MENFSSVTVSLPFISARRIRFSAWRTKQQGIISFKIFSLTITRTESKFLGLVGKAPWRSYFVASFFFQNTFAQLTYKNVVLLKVKSMTRCLGFGITPHFQEDFYPRKVLVPTMFLKVTASWPFAWWYSMVPVLLRMSPLDSFFTLFLPSFRRFLACSSLQFVNVPQFRDCVMWVYRHQNE